MSDNLYFGGVPTEPDVAAIERAFHIEAGTSFPAEDIANVIGVDAKSDRFNVVLLALRKKMRREKGLRMMRKCGLVKFLTSPESLAESIRDLVGIGRKALHAYRDAELTIRPEELSEERRYTLRNTKRELLGLVEQSKDAQKVVATPKPVTKSALVRRLPAEQCASV